MKFGVIYIVLLLLGSFTLTYLLIPKIIGVSKFKRLMDSPNERSSHRIATPNLGGISFYINLMLSFYFLDSLDKFNIIPSLLPGLTILFIIGLKDDLTVLSARTKFIAQIVACLFLLAHFKFEIYTLNGFMGIESINPYLAGVLALFIMVAVINSYNLIDGIDGLASIIGLIIFLLFSLLFLSTKSYLSFGLAVVMMGGLVSFLRYNFSNRQKIFMGDTGTMIVGFLIAAMTVRLLSMPKDILNFLPFLSENVPFVVGAILIVPLYDTSRVIIIRLLQNRGPFSPDRNHIHHILIDQLQFTHAKASLTLGAFNVLFVGIIFLLSIYFPVYQVAMAFLLMIFVLTVLLFKITQRQRFKNNLVQQN